MKNKKNELLELKNFLVLWSTQGISQLGSSMTAFALTLWLYEKTGSSLSTAALMICSYAPYVIMSVFAGALTDRFDKKKAMLGCDLDQVCEPFMSSCGSRGFLQKLFGTGKGSGAALMMFLLGVAGVFICIMTGRKLKQYHYTD